MKVRNLLLVMVAIGVLAARPVPAAVPILQNGSISGNAFTMDIVGAYSAGWILQRCNAVAPLPVWTTVAVLPAGPNLGVVDPTGAATLARYYRVVSIPVPVNPSQCSANAYGFYRKTLPAGCCMVADHLQSDAGNTLANLYPVLPDSTTCYKYALGWQIDFWDITNPGWNFGTITLNPGEGLFLCGPGPATPLAYIGTVPQSVLTTPIPTGFSIVSSKVPQAGLLTTDLGFPAQPGDVVYTFGCGGGAYTVSVFDDLDLTWAPSEPFIDIGESFWINATPAHPAWVRIFSVCP